MIRKVRRRRCRKHSGGVWAAGHKAPKRGYFRSDPLGVPRHDGKNPRVKEREPNQRILAFLCVLVVARNTA